MIPNHISQPLNNIIISLVLKLMCKLKPTIDSNKLDYISSGLQTFNIEMFNYILFFGKTSQKERSKCIPSPSFYGKLAILCYGGF